MLRSQLLVRSAEIAEACGRYDDMLSLAIAAARTACNEPPVASSARRGSWLALVPGADAGASIEAGVPSLRCLATLARASKLAVSTTRSPLRMLDVLDEHESDLRLKRVAGDYRREIAGKAASTRTQVQHCLESIVMPALMRLADEEEAEHAEDGIAPARSASRPSTTTARAMAVAARLLGDLSRYAVEADGVSSTGGGGTSSTKSAHGSIHSAAALSWYSKAQQFSHVLPAWSPLRLAVALNLSVFLFEHQGEEAEGSRVAREAAEDAATALASATDGAVDDDDAAGLTAGPSPEIETEGGEEAISEAERLLGLLRENLSAWRRVMRVDTIVV